MSNIAKVFIISICILITAQFLSISFFVLAPQAVAADPPEGFTPTDIRDQVKIPFGNFSDLGSVTFDVCSNAEKGDTNPPRCWKIPWLAKYIGNAYKYGVVIGSVLAVMMIMIGGVMYMIGGLNQTLIGKGKELIVGAVTGLILLLGSYVLLNTVNPNLIHMQAIEVEVIKEQIMSEGKYCSQTEAQKDASGAQIFDVVPSNWKDSNTCGQELDVKISTAGSAGGSKDSGKQTCISDSCGNTGKACIIDFATQNHECKDVVMYGTITYPDIVKTATCGHVTQTVMGEGFYLDAFRLVLLSPDGWSQKRVPITNWIPWGKDKFQYSIDKSKLMASMNESPSKVTIPGIGNLPVPDDSQVLLEIEVNDSSWPMFATIDDKFIVTGRTNKFGMAPNEVLPVIICKSQDKWKTFGLTKAPNDKGLLYTSSSPLLWKDLKANAGGVRWDINITKDFYSCKAGATSEALDKADCKYATSVDPGESKYGDPCTQNSNCMSVDEDGKAYSSKAPLVCSNNKCTFGIDADKCDYSDTGISGDTGECSSGFVCAGSPIPDQCVRKPGGYLQRCDKGKSTCGPGLTCVEPQSWNEDQSNNPLSCGDDDVGGELIDIYMCYPSEYDPNTPTLCWCNENSDCPSSHPYCVEDLSNDDQTGTKDSFCSTGEPGVPCKDANDCKGANTKCWAGTCYISGSYYATSGPDDGKNIAKLPKPTVPQALADFYK